MTDNTQADALAALIERFRGLHIDHKPDGRPAVRTRELTALLDRIADLEAQLEAIGAGGVSALMGAAKAGSEPVAWAIFAEGGNIRLWSKKPLLHPSAPPLYTHPSPTEGMAGWQPIETAPKDKTNVILRRQACGSVANGFWLAEAYAGNGSWIWPYVPKNPTHWIPAPPIASEAKGAGHA